MHRKSFLTSRSVFGPIAAAFLISAVCHTAQAQSSTATNLTIPVHLLAGYGTDMKIQGTDWIDGSKYFADGSTIERPDITIKTNADTGPAAIYKAERYSMTKFNYGPIPNGDYTVKLHFCETFEGITQKGDRVFGYTVKEDGPPVKDFDVFASAGGALKPVVKTVPVSVTNHKIEIDFVSQTENPQINAIEILRKD